TFQNECSPAPLPLLFDDPFVTTVQLVQGLLLPGVSSARKSANVCALSAFLGLKRTSNSDSSTDHFVIRPARSGLNKTVLSG
ncbi:hypothetical protein A2U01_0078818, partial [Trifolium medium]|nr:hypothetical protein [Trifolium medium]